MTITLGIDVGSTYIKGVVLDEGGDVLGTSLQPSGFKLGETAELAYDDALAAAGLMRSDIAYVVATGIGRHQVAFKNLHVTDLTAAARGATRLFPGARTVLDVGGQTMKALRTDESSKVVSFRLNDKCAAGTGAFLEKTARYMGYTTKEIGPLMTTSKEPVPISGVCAVFAESEVINHLSIGTAPAEIMQGAIESLTTRCVQLIKRVKAQPEYVLVGGILRFSTMARAVEEQLKAAVKVPDEDLVQHVGALGCAILGHLRLQKLRDEGKAATAV